MTKPLVPSVDRQDNFAAIRLVAAVLVIFGHAFPLTGAIGPGYMGNPVSTLAVKVFFVISGYLISGSWFRDPNILRYLLRRSLRIFPGLIALCLLTIIFAGIFLTTLPFIEYIFSMATWIYLKNIFLYPIYHLPGVFYNNIYPSAVNGSLWTLPVEFAMYLLLPIALFLPYRRYSILLITLCLAAASLWVTRMHVPSQPTIIWGTSMVSALGMAPYFFLGAVYHIWIPRKYLNLQIGFMSLIVMALFANDPVTAEVICLILTPYLTLALGYAKPPVFSFAERLGDPSYGTYLYGFLCQQVVGHYFPFRDAAIMNFALSVIPALVLGMLSWNLIEKPALNWKPLRPKQQRTFSTETESVNYPDPIPHTIVQ